MHLMIKGKVVRRLECCEYQVYCNGTLCFTWFRASSRGKIFTSYSIAATTRRWVHRYKRNWARHIQAQISGTQSDGTFQRHRASRAPCLGKTNTPLEHIYRSVMLIRYFL